jgi:hypothetical protein
MLPFDELWRRLHTHAGETFFEMGGRRFTYELHPDRLGLSDGRTLTRRDVERVYGQGEITSLRRLKEQGIAHPSPIFSLLTDPRLKQG